MKELIRSWDREFPGRVYNVFMSMQRVSPSHLMDRRLYDFDALAPVGADDASDE